MAAAFILLRCKPPVPFFSEGELSWIQFASKGDIKKHQKMWRTIAKDTLLCCRGGGIKYARNEPERVGKCRYLSLY